MVKQNDSHSPLLVDSLQQNISKEAAPLLNFVLRHSKAIALGLVVLVGAMAGFGIYNYMHEQKIAHAQERLGELAVSASTESQLKALKTFVATVPAQVQPAGLLALAKASLRVKDYASAVDAWGKLQSLNVEGMHDLAGLGKADAYARMGDYKKAQEVLTAMLPDASEAYVLPAKHQLALMAEQSGDMKTSLMLYKDLEEAVPEANKAFYTRKVALLTGKLKD